MANRSQLEIDRIDILIITVGTRQVGWRSDDGIIRCFGADGDRSHPPHIDQLYAELGVERQSHPGEKFNPRWSVRDLGRRYWELCEAADDFSRVELLLDGIIIADAAKRGLNSVVLWATDQPESVPWNYRRADTLYLAKLMAGKIRATWPGVAVDVLHPVVNANDRNLIREEVEQFILPIAFDAARYPDDRELVLAIENKGAVPALAEGLEICAAALVRQCQVLVCTPVEPDPPYDDRPDGARSVRAAFRYDEISVGEYFWPLERMRVISAWERGDFKEAHLWLKSHQSRYKHLYQLADFLSGSENRGFSRFILDKNFENGWLRSRAVSESAGSETVRQWREQLQQLKQNQPAQVWESIFSLELLLMRENYTRAFFQFSQTIERLLYLRCKTENWIDRSHIIPNPNFKGDRRDYNPGFKELIEGWFTSANRDKEGSIYRLFDNIRQTRNEITHQAKPLSKLDLMAIWSGAGWRWESGDETDGGAIVARMMETINMVCNPSWELPKSTLTGSLYRWGLNLLHSEQGNLP